VKREVTAAKFSVTLNISYRNFNRIVSLIGHQVMNFPIAEHINDELRKILNEVLERGDETEYVRFNPILRNKIAQAEENYNQGKWFVPTLKQLGV
jgi:transcriptional regulator NrdR family protein